jgi:hypothetical protein
MRWSQPLALVRMPFREHGRESGTGNVHGRSMGDLISDALPFGRLWDAEPNAIGYTS